MSNTSGPRPSRRALLASIAAAASSPLLAQRDLYAQVAGPAPRPFRVDIPQATIDRILNRVREAQWPDRLDASDWRYGANWEYMKALAEYWTEKFDWRKIEANPNRYPQFLARVSDYDIHFYHVKGRGPRPIPLPRESPGLDPPGVFLSKIVIWCTTPRYRAEAISPFGNNPN